MAGAVGRPLGRIVSWRPATGLTEFGQVAVSSVAPAAEDGAGGAARKAGGDGAGEAGALDPQEPNSAEQSRRAMSGWLMLHTLSSTELRGSRGVQTTRRWSRTGDPGLDKMIDVASRSHRDPSATIPSVTPARRSLPSREQPRSPKPARGGLKGSVTGTATFWLGARAASQIRPAKP